MSASKLLNVCTEPGNESTWPRWTSVLLTPFNMMPHWSPACPSSRVLWNISMPATVAFRGLSFMPKISTMSPVFTTPRSMRPVATVPLAGMARMLSMPMRNGLSTARGGSGMNVSQASMRVSMVLTPHSPVSPLSALSAEPRMKGVSSPGNLYMSSISRTSNSTRSTSSMSSTMSILFRKTTIRGTPICRDNKMCSRVCGMGPS
mmetsp:Transcript_16592/g.41767  ORF Transcript_16592/g.41767 Transcript_16592/m.41767 type:complete len:204 (+) Transcript_16592:352-963(+)